MGNLLSQSFFIPSPALTENNVPDQSGRVHLITGGYSGCGKELARILYAANADVWIAGRSEERAEAAIQEIRETPNSKGSIQFLYLDLANLMTIRPAVDRFLKDTGVRLHVLTNNAGVMLPPSGSKTAQGLELQMGVNCVGPFLLTRLLTPALRDQAVKEASANRHGIVRVTWASSIGADLGSPKGGVDISLVNEPPKITSQITDYAQSKAGNILLAAEAARRETSRASESNAAVLHCAFNPGNLKSGLQRHLSSAQKIIVHPLAYPAINGGYTELFAALSSSTKNGDYIVPFGRHGKYRSDLKSKSDNEGGRAKVFWEWCENVTNDFI